jgi:hypothetical protein
MSIDKTLQIIVTGITTLDEARYFAAMGADWIGFNAHQLSAAEIKEIADWVVGPKMFIEMDVIQEDLLFEISNKNQLNGICLPYDQDVPAWYTGSSIRRIYFPSKKELLSESNFDVLLLQLEKILNEERDLDALRHICMNHTCWIEADSTDMSITKLCEKLPVNGIVIRCNEESKNHSDGYAQYDMFFEEMEKVKEN